MLIPSCNLLTLHVTLLLFADTGHAIKCFACSSAANGCGDPFEKGTEAPTCATCYKAMGEINGETGTTCVLFRC